MFRQLSIVIIFFIIGMLFITPVQAKQEKRKKKGKKTPFPSNTPSFAPSLPPTDGPSHSPTTRPSMTPSTGAPSEPPTEAPSASPSYFPSNTPMLYPTSVPSFSPTISRTTLPSSVPTVLPTIKLTSVSPTMVPSKSPSNAPTLSSTVMLTLSPSHRPSFAAVDTKSPAVIRFPPSSTPTDYPTTTQLAASTTTSPSISPSTISPSAIQIVQLTAAPSISVEEGKTLNPTKEQNFSPTLVPSDAPSPFPTITPSDAPSNFPSMTPSEAPSTFPIIGGEEELLNMRLSDMRFDMQLPTAQAESFDVTAFGSHLSSFLDSAFRDEFNNDGIFSFSHVSMNVTKLRPSMSRNRRAADDHTLEQLDEELALLSTVTILVVGKAFFQDVSVPSRDEIDTILIDWLGVGSSTGSNSESTLFGSSLQTANNQEIASIVSYTIDFSNATESSEENEISTKETGPSANASIVRNEGSSSAKKAGIAFGCLSFLIVVSSISFVLHKRRKKKDNIFEDLSEGEKEKDASECVSSTISNVSNRVLCVEDWCLDDASQVIACQKGLQNSCYDASGLARIVKISNEVVKKSKAGIR